MVLIPPAIRASFVSAIALAALMIGSACSQRPAVVPLDQPARVAVAFSFDDLATGQPRAVAPDFVQEISAPLQQRNLQPEVLELRELLESFTARRASSHRFAWLAEQSQSADLALLIEAQAGFYSQLRGRFRWTVTFKCTMGRPDAPELAVQRSFEVPVFLRFPHEGQDEALQEAADILRRNLARLADTALADPGGRWGSQKDQQSTVPGATQGRRAPKLGPIYFVLVDRFDNGNPDNDGNIDLDDPQAFHGGDLPGLSRRLDYLQDLGVETVWLSPITKMRRDKLGEHGAFHGYWMEEPGELDPHLGDEQELAELVAGLEARGMSLLLDQVTNHLAYDAQRVTEMPEWFHGKGDITDWNDPVQVTDHDVHGLPDLAHERAEVSKWLIDHGLAWLQRARPRGLRLDAVRHVPNAFWSRYNTALQQAADQDLVLLGEVFDGDPQVLAATWRSGGFTHLFDFPLYYAMRDSLCGEAPLGRLASVLSADRLYPNAAQLVTFADNHDLPRLLTACAEDQQRAHQLLSFQLTTRGVPALTYGTEIGLRGAGEPVNRGDMHFEAAAEHPTHALIQQLLEQRRSHPALSRGETHLLAVEPDFLAYLRATPEEAVVIMVSRGDANHSVELPTAFKGAHTRELLSLGSPTEQPPGPLSISGQSLRVVQLVPIAGSSFPPTAPNSAKPATVDLHFTAAPVGPAEQLVLVGAGAQLGNWQPQAGQPLEATEEGWSVTLQVPAGRVLEFKLVVLGAEAAPRWEPGDNRYHLVRGDQETQAVRGKWQS